jgi:hypothetical protein
MRAYGFPKFLIYVFSRLINKITFILRSFNINNNYKKNMTSYKKVNFG